MGEAKTLYAEFTARPGHEDEVERLVAGLAEQVRQEPGNVTFIAHRLVEDPRAFFVYEEYADADAFGVAAWNRSPATASSCRKSSSAALASGR